MAELEFDLGTLLKHELATRFLIAPTIYRLSARRRDWAVGHAEVVVTLRRKPKSAPSSLSVRVYWSLASMALDYGESGIREDVRKLAKTKDNDEITEAAALGMAFALVQLLLPDDKITKVVKKGGRGDFHLNGRRDQMIEISGTWKGDVTKRFSTKKHQVLLNKELSKAYVCVTGFEAKATRLERVK